MESENSLPFRRSEKGRGPRFYQAGPDFLEKPVETDLLASLDRAVHWPL
jgi:hypothetical protein